MQLTTARRIISAGMEQGGLLGQAIGRMRAARKQERASRRAGRRHPHRRAQRQKRRAVLDIGVALAAEYERIRRAFLADAATWQVRGEVCDET